MGRRPQRVALHLREFASLRCLGHAQQGAEEAFDPAVAVAEQARRIMEIAFRLCVSRFTQHALRGPDL